MPDQTPIPADAIRAGANALVQLRTQAPSIDELPTEDQTFWLRDAEAVLRAADLAEVYDVLAAVNALHQPQTNSIGHDWCKACNALWPCRTSKAIEGPAPVPGSSRRAQEPGCICWDGNPENYEGADRDCPQHGELAGESQASESARRPLSPASAVAVEVIAELARAEAKFPDQHLPDGTGPDVVWGITGPASWAADQARVICQQKAEDGFVTWLDVLREEVAEGFAESEWAKLRPELIQVAAMAIRWILDGDSRLAAPELATGGIIRRDQAVIVGEQSDGCGPDCSERHTYAPGCEQEAMSADDVT